MSLEGSTWTWPRVARFLKGSTLVLLEVVCFSVHEAFQSEQLWQSKLTSDFLVTPTKLQSRDAKIRYAECSAACFLEWHSGRFQRAETVMALRVLRACGLSLMLSLDGAAFVVMRVEGLQQSLPGSWPMVGAVEDTKQAENYLKRGQSRDMTQDPAVWSLCLLDDWVWCANRYVRCPSLPAWRGFETPAEIGLFICAGRLAFFRRRADVSVDQEPWGTTGFVLEAYGGHSPVSRLVRPIAIGAEEGKVAATFVGVFPRAPFEPHRCVEALENDWRS